MEWDGEIEQRALVRRITLGQCHTRICFFVQLALDCEATLASYICHMSSVTIALKQPSLLDQCPVIEAVEQLAFAGGIEERGAVNTRREVADFILDLCGYTVNQPLHTLRLLEPSFGNGDFLIPAVERLLQAWQAAGAKGEPMVVLGPCIRAVELHRHTYERTFAAVVQLLTSADIPSGAALALTDHWLLCGDFLLDDLSDDFDVVVGNPPYVRQELIPPVLLAEYRNRYNTVYDRADLYIPFIERSLRALKTGGVLGFICADRWMKNRYGGPLRAMVAKDFHLRVYVDMNHAPAFHSDVVAYPAVTIIGHEKPGITRTAHNPEISSQALTRLAGELMATSKESLTSSVREMISVAAGAEPWILDSSDQMVVLRRLEQDFPTLEEAGCKVGIGVATGADKVFIGRYDGLDVEEDRKLPLVMTRDIQSGRVEWRGFGVVNPFKDGPGSGLVDLADYPRLQRYLEGHKDAICRRHVALKAPANWYRTIDRITESLTNEPKLLIPDIKGDAQIVYDEGRFYPHHNLYFVTSTTWDLQTLQAVLLSSVTRLFVASYSTKMRGGFLRFQAQYLRRIRLPRWEKVPQDLRAELRAAAQALDMAACNRAVFKLYGLTAAEAEALGGNGE